MWLLILMMITPFVLLAIIEEATNFFVNRYLIGSYDFESKVKALSSKYFNRIKGKLIKKKSTSNNPGD